MVRGMQQLFVTESVPMLVAAVRRRIKQLAWEHLRPLGVTPQQAGVLLALQNNDGVSLTELARAMHIDNPTACRIVNTLVKRNWLQTRADPDDRRRFRLHLTASGKRLGKNLTERARGVQHILEGMMDTRDTAQLRTLLTKFLSRLEADESRAAAPS